MKTSKISTRSIVITGILLAITVILGMTPLGMIPIPPIAATIIHIPLLIGALLEGPVIGSILGLGFGMFSMYHAMITPGPLAFIFLDPLVAVLPRLLIAPVALLIKYALDRMLKGRAQLLSVPVAAVAGSLTNTVGVLGMIYIRYGAAYAGAIGIDQNAVLGALGGIALTQGLAEAVVSGIIVTAVVKAILQLYKKNR